MFPAAPSWSLSSSSSSITDLFWTACLDGFRVIFTESEASLESVVEINDALREDEADEEEEEECVGVNGRLAFPTPTAAKDDAVSETNAEDESGAAEEEENVLAAGVVLPTDVV